MNDAISFINTEGLKFFGKVNASISHELKNILAIISETAGFLNDLTELAKQGKDLKLSLLENCSDSIAEEIQRGFATIKQMNRFAHSVDVPVKEINLPETLDLMVHLSGFLSYATRVHVHHSGLEIKPVLTCPFLMQNLLYQMLCLAYESAGPDGEIHIDFQSKEPDRIHLHFSNRSHVTLLDFPNQNIQKAADILGIQLNISGSPFRVEIGIPYANDKIARLAEHG